MTPQPASPLYEDTSAAPSTAGRNALRYGTRRLLILALFLSHALLVFHCSLEDFATWDEIGNFTAGIAYWEYGEYDLYNVNPPLTKLLSSLPALFAQPDIQAIQFTDIPGNRPEWRIGDQFARDNAPRYHNLIILGRIAGLGWSILGGWLVLKWATTLWGTTGGITALTAWCFEPNVIAHAHLITADLPAAVAALGAAYLFRTYLLHPTWGNALIAGVGLGISQLCKLTLVLLSPTWAILWLIFLFARRPSEFPIPRAHTQLGQLLILFAVSILTINAGYEFTGSFKQLKDYPFVSKRLGGPLPEGQEYRPQGQYDNRFKGHWSGELLVPLPEAYVRGIDVQRKDFEIYQVSRPSYLRGEWRIKGWWYYYLYAAFVKIPLGVWGLFVLALITPWFIRINRNPWYEMVLLWPPILVIFIFVSSQLSLQRHFRYVLPVLPFFIVYLGRAGTIFSGHSRILKVLVIMMLVGAIGSYLRLHPHSLAYFNEMAGGPENGHNHLLGSNIDWGQDLLRLKRWLDKHPEARPLHFAYFNHIDPRVAGIEFIPPPPGVTDKPPPNRKTARLLGPLPGYYAISVRYVRGARGPIPNGSGGYQFYPLGSFGYFHRFRPIAKAGYSIFIYHITPEQANAVREQSGLPPVPSESERNVESSSK